jgi:uncharacterized phage-associated protein
MEIEDAAWIVAKAHRHGLPQVRLLKLLWLAELRHYEGTGSRLTDAEWYRWEYGPYSKDVVNAVKKERAHFEVEETQNEFGNRMLLVRAAKPLESKGAAAERQAIEDVLWLYKDFTTQEILYDVYGDPFFEGTPYSENFDFEKLASFRDTAVTEADANKLRSQRTAPLTDLAELFGD